MFCELPTAYCKLPTYLNNEKHVIIFLDDYINNYHFLFRARKFARKY